MDIIFLVERDSVRPFECHLHDHVGMEDADYLNYTGAHQFAHDIVENFSSVSSLHKDRGSGILDLFGLASIKRTL